MQSDRQLLRKQVSDAIVALIFERGLKPGDKLATEIDLAKSFSVSRNVVREAVRDLSARGVIDVRRGKGLFVGRPRVISSSRDLELGVGMDPGLLTQLVEARRVIELGMSQLIVSNVTPDQVDDLRKVVDASEAVVESGGEGRTLAQLDLRFHLILLKASGNEVLGQFGAVLIEFFARNARVQWNPEEERIVVEDHRRIYEAVAAGDVDTLRIYLAAHLVRITESTFLTDVTDSPKSGLD